MMVGKTIDTETHELSGQRRSDPGGKGFINLLDFIVAFFALL